MLANFIQDWKCANQSLFYFSQAYHKAKLMILQCIRSKVRERSEMRWVQKTGFCFVSLFAKDKICFPTLHFKNAHLRSCCGSVEMKLVSMRMQVWSLALRSGLRIQHCISCRVGSRRSSDPTLLWLWHRSAAAGSIWPLAWALPYAPHAALTSDNNNYKNAHP